MSTEGATTNVVPFSATPQEEETTDQAPRLREAAELADEEFGIDELTEQLLRLRRDAPEIVDLLDEDGEVNAAVKALKAAITARMAQLEPDELYKPDHYIYDFKGVTLPRKPEWPFPIGNLADAHMLAFLFWNPEHILENTGTSKRAQILAYYILLYPRIVNMQDAIEKLEAEFGETDPTKNRYHIARKRLEDSHKKHSPDDILFPQLKEYIQGHRTVNITLILDRVRQHTFPRSRVIYYLYYAYSKQDLPQNLINIFRTGFERNNIAENIAQADASRIEKAFPPEIVTAIHDNNGKTSSLVLGSKALMILNSVNLA